MKTTLQSVSLSMLLGLALSTPTALLADTSEEAAKVKEKLESLRKDCADGRRQVTVTIEELARLTVKDVDLRPQFEKFKAELVKMEEKATKARERADAMKAKGQEFFSDAEKQVVSIQNENIRKAAEKRLQNRKKSYGKILSAMQEAKAELVPFMSDLNDLKKMFDSELTTTSVNSAKDLIRQARWHGADVAEALEDVEKELDRVAAELAKYQ
jgi:chromosome segregation ATPase